MISFILFIGLMISCFSILTGAIFYGDKVFVQLGHADRQLQSWVLGKVSKDVKQQRILMKKERDFTNYMNAVQAETVAHRKEMELGAANQVLAWEKKFYGDDNLPPELVALEAAVRSAYTVPGPLLAIEAPKKQVVEQPLVPELLSIPNTSSPGSGRYWSMEPNDVRERLGMPPLPEKRYYQSEIDDSSWNRQMSESISLNSLSSSQLTRYYELMAAGREPREAYLMVKNDENQNISSEAIQALYRDAFRRSDKIP